MLVDLSYRETRAVIDALEQRQAVLQAHVANGVPLPVVASDMTLAGELVDRLNVSLAGAIYHAVVDGAAGGAVARS